MDYLEYFDIVDENNILTGEKRLRTDAHTQGLWHRTVHIYLFREAEADIEFLVHLRAKTKDSHPNEWDTRFGGHIKSGETVEDAVIGELRDEIGLEIDFPKIIKGEIYKRDKYPNREFTKVFYYNFTGEIDDLKFNDGEVQEVKLMKSNDILEAIRREPDKWAESEKGFVQIFNVLKSKLSDYET
ncbi:MAG: NUDIX domain-containing protein [bacterium]